MVMAIAATPTAADTSLTAGQQAVVSQTNGDGVNVRDAAGYGRQIIFAFPEGTEVNVTGGPAQAGDGSTWYQVSAYGVEGWVISDYLSAGGSGGGHASYQGVLTVAGTDGNGLRLRSGAGTDSSTLTVLLEGAQVAVVGADVNDGAGNTWANVSYNGTTGYASKAYLSPGGEAAEHAKRTGPGVGDLARRQRRDQRHEWEGTDPALGCELQCEHCRGRARRLRGPRDRRFTYRP